jgi:hypothetical protein
MKLKDLVSAPVYANEMLNETFGSLASIKSVDLILQLKIVFPKTYTDNQSVNENPILKNKATEGDVQHRFHFLPFGQNESLVISCSFISI